MKFYIVEEKVPSLAMAKLYPSFSGEKEIVVVAGVKLKAAAVVEEKEAAASENDDSIIYQIHKFEEEWSDEDETNESTKSDPTKFLSKLSGKIAQLYEKMDISDVSLCVSGKEIKVLFISLSASIKKIDTECFAPLTV
uniref:Uncharacterized protein n=1 Tax=Panagrolaimus sp. PS1159 TaxID=55785 RepID=A0AC35FB14_9BILA